MKLLFSTAFIIGTTAAGCLGAANSDKTVSGMDSQFAGKAAIGGMAEVKLGQLAQRNASSGDVKAFGQKMIADHTKAAEKLKDVASKDNISLPTNLDAKENATYDRLSKLQGSDFDRAYMQDMVKDHKMDVAEFHKEANSGRNPDLKNFASETLPTLQEHLRLAETTYAKVK